MGYYLDIQREPVHGLWDEMTPLLQAGFLEHDPYPELPLDIDRKMYEALEDCGCLRVYTARIGGELSGYAVFMLMPSSRRRLILQAQQDVVHATEATKGRVTPALVRYSEKALRTEGVKLIYHSAPGKGSRFGRLLEIMGYRPIGEVHAKLLA